MKIGTRKIFLWGSKITIDRVVIKENGRYFVKWYGNEIEVVQVDGFEGNTRGWKTVESY